MKTQPCDLCGSEACTYTYQRQYSDGTREEFAACEQCQSEAFRRCRPEHNPHRDDARMAAYGFEDGI
jgi:hypothetical protein